MNLSSILRFVFIGIMAVALLFTVIGLASPSWYTDGHFKFGILNDNCDCDYVHVTNKLMGTLLFFAFFLEIAAIVWAVLTMFLLKNRLWAAGVFALLAAFFAFMTVGVFGQDFRAGRIYSVTGYHLGYAFYLALFGGLLSALGSVLPFFLHFKGGNDD